MSELENKIQLPSCWKEHLKSEFNQPYMLKLRKFLISEMKRGRTIYPHPSLYFNALNKTLFEKVKVVIVGQDPYHGPHQAHGLSFSVPKGVAIPPSLKNIFKELKRDLEVSYPDHGCLEHWAQQGVLLLNSVLTVVSGKAGSHQNQGWEKFTDSIISVINKHKQNIVFLLWGSYATTKCSFLDDKKHLVLMSSHPSPFSVNRGFDGCSHFSKTNEYLKQHSMKEIEWRLSL